jgi:hypothetical protein
MRRGGLYFGTALTGVFSILLLVVQSSGAAPASRPAASDKAGSGLMGPRAGLRGRFNYLQGTAPGESALSPEEVDRLMTFMQRNFPLMYQRLNRVRERDSAQFQRMINRHARSLLPMLNAARNNPELAQKMIAEHRARLEIQDLKDKYTHAADPDERARLREEMRRHMDVAFEARLERLRMEVQKLQQRLDDAKQQLSVQEQNKSRLIDEHLNDLLSQKTP